ncbi:alpha/beta fold hydrolase [Nonomuraea sp. NPDC050790]|uniref:alpha/beta fold hydrolase n=1 Tax=Nonomuraea sp. NPDC050790 TaxID=3364371 RepID=UPI0037B51AE6
MAAIAREGAELAWSASGREGGPVVVHAHGAMSSRAGEERHGLFGWEPVARVARLVRYDARAHGASSGRAVPEDYLFTNLARDLLAVVDHLDAGPVTGMGASMGTATVLHAALARPDAFERLVLVIPPTAWETRKAMAAHYREAAEAVEARGPRGFAETMAGEEPAAIFAEGPAFPLPDVPWKLLPSVMRGLAASDLPAPAELATLAQPALILAWETDDGHPLSTAEALADLLPAATLHVSATVADVRTWGARVAAFLTARS